MLLAVLALGLALGGPLLAQEPAPSSIDFARDVRPIFERHCIRCHGPEEQKGDLRLDSRAAAQRGGHSGGSLLTANRDDSELYLRLVSDSDTYRMPRDNPPLSEDQIKVIGSWIDAGAPWPEEKTDLPLPAQPDTSWTQRAAELWILASDKLEQPSWQWLVLSLAIGGVLLLVWFWWRGRRQDVAATKGGAGLSPWIALLGLILVAAVLFLSGRVTELQNANSDLQQRIANLEPVPEADPQIDLTHLPLPPYPMHPPRLGGTYYRGNDERSSALFNGGFYRTATIELRLIDGSGTPMEWNDPIPDSLAVELTIERAPNATPELFTERVRNTVSLKHYRDPAGEDDQEPAAVTMDAVEVGQTWRLRIPVDPSSSWTDDRQDGVIYLFYGAQQRGQHMGRAHFAIRYQLQRDPNRNTIDPASVLWMGSLYNLAGRVLVPGRGEVLLDRWFDFRPIPVIEGEPSQDPVLLGLPEHQKSQ